MHRSHESKFISWVRTMVNGLIYLFQGILILLTLGWLTPHWDIDYVFYCSKKDMKKRIDDHERIQYDEYFRSEQCIHDKEK